MLLLPHCYLRADLSLVFSGHHIDKANGIVEGVSSENGRILLRVYAEQGGLHVINRSPLNKFPSLIHVVSKLHFTATITAVEVITHHVSGKPFGVIELDIGRERLVTLVCFYLSQLFHEGLVEGRSGLDYGLISVQNVDLQGVWVHSRVAVAVEG
jgi:hypothetical protein